MLRIHDLKIRKDLTESEILEMAIHKYAIQKEDILNWYITKKSIDARKKEDVHYIYSLAIEVKEEKKYPKL